MKRRTRPAMVPVLLCVTVLAVYRACEVRERTPDSERAARPLPAPAGTQSEPVQQARAAEPAEHVVEPARESVLRTGDQRRSVPVVARVAEQQNPKIDAPPTDAERRMYVPVQVVDSARESANQRATTTPEATDTLDPVIVRALPRTYQVVPVAVPPAFAGQMAIAYTIRAEDGFSAIGRTGMLNAREHKSALVTIGIAADVQAGRTAAAWVTFTNESRAIVVPIVVEVQPIRRIAVSAEPRTYNVQAGDRFDLKFAVSNLGNTVDTVRVELAGPENWRATRDTFSLAVIAAGETRQFSTRVDVPERSGTGGFFFRVRARAGDTATVHEQTITVTVGDDAADDGPPGPVLRTGIGSVSVDGAAPQSVALVSITGPIAADVAIDARISTTPELQPNAVRGLNRVGAFLSEPRLSLWSPTWRLDAGSTLTRFTDLTGVNAGATGVSFAYEGDRHEAGLLLGRPFAANGSDDGHLLGVRGGTTFGPLRVSAALTSLDAQAASRQKLDAAGVEMSVNAFGAGVLGTELAWRQYNGGSGAGWRLSFEQQNNRGYVNARAVHAPGGSSAFARAVDEITISADRGFGRFHLGGSFLSARDDNDAFETLESNAWSVTPQYRIRDNTTVRLMAHGAAYDVEGATAFGNRATGVAAGVTSQAGNLFYSIETGVERYSRNITLDGQRYEASAPRYSLRGGASYAMPYGLLQFETAYDRTTDATIAPEQLLILLRADRMQFRFLPSGMYLSAEVSHQRWAGERSFVAARAGATYSLPQGFDISASLERNPIGSGLAGRTPVVFSLRVDRRISLPRLPYGAFRGRVFQDLNGNGVWESGEPGAARVTVRRNGARAVTDRNGVYTFWDARGDAPVEIDAVTLPHGWIAAEPAGSPRDLPLTVLSSLIVRFELGAPERARNVDISRATVIARDATGREWIARRNGPESAVFDALPAGTYTLDFNFDASGEPLRTDRTYTVTLGGSTETVTVRVQGRPLRFRSSGG